MGSVKRVVSFSAGRAQRVKGGGTPLVLPLTICDLPAITRPAAPAPWFPDASCSCTSCSPTGFRLHDEAVCRPASAPSSRQEMLRPPLSCAGSHGSFARLHCWFGSSPNAQRESHSSKVHFQPFNGFLN